ncbi:Hypothetical predicted protein [Xyrichtys novacula]|uniref:Uncharacterized protein n=1 Tax=Xyrichtys novacula TaxID=13765 RepID=A0AAV1GT50_XYRNO|nr:Hypothetical predicted protein [Xyrichtys novacula]
MAAAAGPTEAPALLLQRPQVAPGPPRLRPHPCAALQPEESVRPGSRGVQIGDAGRATGVLARRPDIAETDAPSPGLTGQSQATAHPPFPQNALSLSLSHSHSLFLLLFFSLTPALIPLRSIRAFPPPPPPPHPPPPPPPPHTFWSEEEEEAQPSERR